MIRFDLAAILSQTVHTVDEAIRRKRRGEAWYLKLK